MLFNFNRFSWTVIAMVIIALAGCNDRPTQMAGFTYELLPRQKSIQYASEWAMMKNNAGILKEKIKKNPSDKKSLMSLCALFIQEGRNTGNFNYYNQASLSLIEKTLKQDPHNFEALTFKATILLSQHRFEDALIIAKDLAGTYPHNAYVYGIMADASLELGDYEAAIKSAENMVSIRPDIRSYSRIAYMREIFGDIPGSIEAMQLAVDAGAPGDENTEWCRVHLGKLFEQMGKMKEASHHYQTAMENRSNYPYAIAGMARVAAREKQFQYALKLYLQADSCMPEHSFKEAMIEMYKLTGQLSKASEIAADIVLHLQKSSGNLSGQNEDHELAHAYMGIGNYGKALEFALKEWYRRPKNIEVNQTLALVYFHKREFAMALPYIESALATNCKNPELLCQAGIIYAKAGNHQKARKLLQEALRNKPNIEPTLEEESRALLNSFY